MTDYFLGQAGTHRGLHDKEKIFFKTKTKSFLHKEDTEKKISMFHSSVKALERPCPLILGSQERRKGS